MAVALEVFKSYRFDQAETLKRLAEEEIDRMGYDD
jgi:hypothetical protein